MCDVLVCLLLCPAKFVSKWNQLQLGRTPTSSLLLLLLVGHFVKDRFLASVTIPGFRTHCPRPTPTMHCGTASLVASHRSACTGKLVDWWVSKGSKNLTEGAGAGADE